MKRCKRCEELKSKDSFCKRSRSKDGLNTWCKACNSAYLKQYLESHKDESVERSARYYQINRDRILKRQSEYARLHKNEKRLYDASYAPVYRKKHLHEHRVRQAVRRARKRAAEGAYTYDDVIRQGECQKWRCWWCGKPCREEYHIDHLVPLVKGGHNWPSNIVISCPKCNLSKHDKLPEEWAGKLL